MARPGVSTDIAKDGIDPKSHVSIIHFSGSFILGDKIMLVHRSWLLLAAFVGVVLALTARAGSTGQDKPLAGKTLIWGADCDGGIPYVIKDPNGKNRDDEPDGPVTGFE